MALRRLKIGSESETATLVRTLGARLPAFVGSVEEADGAAAGAAAVSGVGVTIRAATGLALGVAAAAAISGATAGSVGAAVGVGTAIGSSDNVGPSPADGAASGLATLVGVGQAIAHATGDAAGAATVVGVASARAEATGIAAGSATATAAAQAIAQAAGTAAGAATVQAVSGATAGSVGASAGVGTAEGVGQGTAEAVGTASGAATVTGVGEDAAFAALARFVFLVPSVRAVFLVPPGASAGLLGSLPKQPAETFLVGADFTRRLDAGEVLVGQSITARNLTVAGDSTGLLLSDPAHAGAVASVRLTAAGTDGQDHRVQFRVITSLGNTHEVELDVRIRGLLLLGRAPKQPGESFKIAADFVRRLGPGETLASETTTATNLASGLPSTTALLVQPAVAGTIAQVRLKAAGAHGGDHRVQMRVVTSLGNTFESELDVAVRET